MAGGEEERAGRPAYVDFEVEIGTGKRRAYPVRLRTPAGDLQATMRFPFTEQALANRLLALENALLRSGGTRRLAPSPDRRAVQEFGQALFDAVLPDDARSLYDQSRRQAELDGKGLRLKLRIEPPELAALPWEFLYDGRRADFVSLSTTTPIVRDLGLPQAIEPLRVTPPLRILGLVASPRGTAQLDVAREQQRVDEALKELRANGLVEVKWLASPTWRDLQQEIRRHAFHVLHFVGHGGFDPDADEGLIVLADEAGEAHTLPATELAMLLADEPALRLVALNSCDGARGGSRDVFSSTASILVRRGIPAVLAMQYDITDEASVEFARAFYEAVADGVPIDAAVAEARKAVRLAIPGTLEWATPVLYQRAPDGVLFDIRRPASPQVAPPAPIQSSNGGTARPAAPGNDAAVGASSALPVATVAAAPAGGESAEKSADKPSIAKGIVSFWSTLPDVLKAVGSVVAGVTALVGAITVMLRILGGDDPEPSPTAVPPTPTIGATVAPTPGPPPAPAVIGGTLSDPRLEFDVTLGEGCENRIWPLCEEYTADDYGTTGLVVNYAVRIQGYAGKRCTVRWSMFNARTGAAVPDLQDQPGWPDEFLTPDGPDDQARADVWVPLPMREGRFFVRLILSNDTGVELARLDTPSFEGMPKPSRGSQPWRV